MSMIINNYVNNIILYNSHDTYMDESRIVVLRKQWWVVIDVVNLHLDQCKTHKFGNTRVRSSNLKIIRRHLGMVNSLFKILKNVSILNGKII